MVLTFRLLVAPQPTCTVSSPLRGTHSCTLGVSWAVDFCGLWLVLFFRRVLDCLPLLTLPCCALFLSSWQPRGPAVLLWLAQSYLHSVFHRNLMSLSVPPYVILGNVRSSWKSHDPIRERLWFWACPLEPHQARLNCNIRALEAWEAKVFGRGPLTQNSGPNRNCQDSTFLIECMLSYRFSQNNRDSLNLGMMTLCFVLKKRSAPCHLLWSILVIGLWGVYTEIQ